MARLLVIPGTEAPSTLVRWNFDEGAELEAGAVLAEIETDKATHDLTIDARCTLLKHLVIEGAVLQSTMPVAIVGAPGEPIDQLLREAYAVLPLGMLPEPGTSARKLRAPITSSNKPRIFACPACAAPLPVEANGRWVCGYCGTTLVI